MGGTVMKCWCDSIPYEYNHCSSVRMSLSPQYSQQNLPKKILAYSSLNTKAFSFYIPLPSYIGKEKATLFIKGEI
jgi:hypothetical protein